MSRLFKILGKIANLNAKRKNKNSIVTLIQMNTLSNRCEYDSESDSPLLNETNFKMKLNLNEEEETSGKDEIKIDIYLINIIFSAFVSSPLSGIYWFTTWHILDQYVFIYSTYLTYFICYLFGFLALFLAYLLQSHLEKFKIYLESIKKWNKFLPLILFNSYMYIVCAGVVLEWQR